MSESLIVRAGGGDDGEIGFRPESWRIEPIGVIPAIASLVNGQLNATAPASRPSMNTGLPLIPPATPLFSSPLPVSRARM